MSSKILDKFKKKKDPDYDYEFYRAQKIKKRIRLKSRISDALFFFAVFASLVSLINAFKAIEIQENSASKQFVDEFAMSYYAYPQNDATKQNLARFTLVPTVKYADEVTSVKVIEVVFNDITSQKIKDDIFSDYNVIVNLEIEKGVNEEGLPIIENQTIYRTFSIVENRITKTYGVIEISPTLEVIFGNTGLSNYEYKPKVTNNYLSEEEKKSAETRTQLFLNQYNESWEKGADLMSDTSSLPRKSADITYQYDGLLSATKSQDGKTWYIQSKIIVANTDFTEAKKLELHLNTESGRVEKMEVY